MLFNSLAFLIFFPIVTVIYFLLPVRFRNAFLLAASCYFYMSYVPEYILILFFLIALDYWMALIIERSPDYRKKLWLIFSVAANVLTLIFFKYFDFFTGHSILLPIGLSFHTMQSMSYVIEVFWGKQKVERNFITYALYVMFFPQLVAGPIERPQNLLKSFYEVHRFDWTRTLSGLKLMALGFYKKVVVADYISILVNPVFEKPVLSTGSDFILASLVFSMQVYCDFSGYSDIARGAARILGIELMLNFNFPFSARNIKDLWRRWHLSLGNWFRDYVYVPLGGNRNSTLRTFFNLIFVFFLSGLWHGTGLNFIAWAELNAVMLAAYVFLNNRNLLPTFLNNSFMGIVGTYFWFSYTVMVFRSPDLSVAMLATKKLFSGGALSYANTFNFTLSCFLIGSLEIVQYFQRNPGKLTVVKSLTEWKRWSVYYLVVLGYLGLTCLSIINQNEIEKPFIYFQF